MMAVQALLLTFMVCYGSLDAVFGATCTQSDSMPCMMIMATFGQAMSGGDPSKLNPETLTSVCKALTEFNTCLDGLNCELDANMMQAKASMGAVKGYCVGSGGSGGGCDIAAISKCDAFMELANKQGSDDVTARCLNLKKAQDCLKALQPKCTGEMATSVVNGIKQLQQLGQGCESLTTVGCTAANFQTCQTLAAGFEDMSSVKEEDCSEIAKVKTCYEGLSSACAGEMKTGADTVLGQLQMVAKVCPNMGSGGSGQDMGCNVESTKCMTGMPMDPNSMFKEPSKVCASVADAVECLKKVKSTCQMKTSILESLAPVIGKECCPVIAKMYIECFNKKTEALLEATTFTPTKDDCNAMGSLSQCSSKFNPTCQKELQDEIVKGKNSIKDKITQCENKGYNITTEQQKGPNDNGVVLIPSIAMILSTLLAAAYMF